MNKHMMGADGTPLLDDDGKKILNPTWLAANPDYTPADDESGEAPGGGGGYTPDAAALAWHDSQVAGLKANQQKALSNNAKNRDRASAAEAEVKRLTAENDELRSTIESAGSSNEELKASLEAKHELHKKNLQTDLDKANETITSLSAELTKHRYDGRLKSASLGVIRKGYEVPAMATLKAMIKETDNGEIICHDINGQPMLDNIGEYMTVEDFINGPFRKLYPDMCQRDVGADDSGDPNKSGGGGGGGGENIFDKNSDKFNRSEQVEMIKNDPQRAHNLMKRAGYSEIKIKRMMGNVRPKAA